jgi:hypothetical protein
VRLVTILFAAFFILGTAAKLRPPEYDEAYSIFLTAGDPRPSWPSGFFHPGDVRSFYAGHPSPAKIAHDLRQGDVHPPLYFWALEYWRRLVGPGWFAARLLSVLLSVAALAGLAWLAILAEIPPASAMLLALFSYGFAYTGIVARGFALAQLLNILGMALILSAQRAGRKQGWRSALLGGLVFGAAAFSNYLAVFIGLATLFWLFLDQKRRKLLPPAALGFALFLPALIYFFRAQHNARIGQFQKFSLPHAVALLAKDSGAALFGGLPIYAGSAGGIVTVALFVFTAICAVFIVKNWQSGLSLFALAACAMPAGLLALGLLFDNTPIEIRYLAFATPFIALLLAQTLPPFWRYLFLGLQACGILGLILAPSTLQPQALAARQLRSLDTPSALVLLPFGNDGVGIPGPFIEAAPDTIRLELLTPNAQPDLSRENRVVLALLPVDDSSKKTGIDLLARFNANPCWKNQYSTKLLRTFTRTCENP